MSSRALSRRRRSLSPLAAVTAVALVFAVLLVLVRLQWPPLESADHGAAVGINGLIAGDAPLVTAFFRRSFRCMGPGSGCRRYFFAAAAVSRPAATGWRGSPGYT